MFAPRCLLAAVASVALVASAVAADPAPAPLPDGKYVIGYTGSPSFLSRAAVIEVKTTDGKQTVGTVSGGMNKWSVSGLKVENGLVKLELSGPINWTFEGKYDPKSKQVLGTLGDDTRVNRAVITPTELDELTQKNSGEQLAVPDDLKQVMTLQNAPFILRNQARQEKDEDKKKELLDKAKEAKVKFEAEAPKLLQKVVESDADAGVIYFTAPDLLGRADVLKAKAEDVKKWAEKWAVAAAAHGPRAERTAVLGTANILAGLDGYADLAVGYAEKAVALTEKGPDAGKVRPLKALAEAQTKGGKADAAKATRATIDKLETALDAEYKKAGPGFTADKYAGRQDKDANRVAVFELFTGAMCGPCTAADLAFDELEATYSPKDLILLQYHQHIPAPDPLTNPDTLARWNYYSELFPKDQNMGGVPSSVFNGKPDLGGGGPRDLAKNKYGEYVKVINKILEEKADVTVAGTATLVDGAVKVDAAVTGKAENATVRVVLAEEEVRYLGSNGIRLHHQVVRSMFGKADGWKVKDLKDGKATASVKLDDLKKSLTEYVDKYHKEEGKFSNPDRPLHFEHLKVIVIVQDDKTGEILNAVQLAVEKKKG